MKKLLCGALALACLASAASAGGVTSWLKGALTPANTVAACQIASALEQTILADEQLANQVAGKQVVRTGTTSKIADVTPALCAQLGGVATILTQSALSSAPVLTPPVANPGAVAQ